MKNKKLNRNFIIVALMALVLMAVLILVLVRNNNGIEATRVDVIDGVQSVTDNSVDIEPNVESVVQSQPAAVETPPADAGLPVSQPVAQSQPSQQSRPTAPATVAVTPPEQEPEETVEVADSQPSQTSQVKVLSSETGRMTPSFSNLPVLSNVDDPPNSNNNNLRNNNQGGANGANGNNGPVGNSGPDDGRPAVYCARGCVDWYHEGGVPIYSMQQCTWNEQTQDRECALVQSSADPTSLTCPGGHPIY